MKTKRNYYWHCLWKLSENVDHILCDRLNFRNEKTMVKTKVRLLIFGLNGLIKLNGRKFSFWPAHECVYFAERTEISQCLETKTITSRFFMNNSIVLAHALEINRILSLSLFLSDFSMIFFRTKSVPPLMVAIFSEYVHVDQFECQLTD